MVKNIIINADDLGFSLGVNEAVLDASNQGFLTHASLMANTQYFEHAVNEILPLCKNLQVGVHVNLTCARALYPENILTKRGFLENSFMNLLFRRKSKVVRDSLEKEIELQILKIQNAGISISHIDGHEHVHIIPSINKIVRRLAKKHNIERIREINEGLFESWKFNGNTASTSNVIKLLLLKFLSFFNENSGKIGFYSMLNTCEINGANLFPFLKNSKSYETIEVMLHPAKSNLDSKEYFKTLNPRFVEFLNNPHREFEYNLCFDENFRSF